jgi:hypothetical protein
MTRLFPELAENAGIDAKAGRHALRLVVGRAWTNDKVRRAVFILKVKNARVPRLAVATESGIGRIGRAQEHAAISESAWD